MKLFESELIDAARDESATADLVIRRLFAQLRNGVQLDLAVIAEGAVRRGDAAPDFVALNGCTRRADRCEHCGPRREAPSTRVTACHKSSTEIPSTFPPNIEATVAGLDLRALRSATVSCADVLAEVSALAARRCSATLPTGIATYAHPLVAPGSARP